MKLAEVFISSLAKLNELDCYEGQNDKKRHDYGDSLQGKEKHEHSLRYNLEK